MLIYRAMWRDPSGGEVAVKCRRQVVDWLAKKSYNAMVIQDTDFSANESYETKWGAVRAAFTDESLPGVRRLRLVEEFELNEARFTTTLRTWPTDPLELEGPWWIWVDVDAVGPTVDRISVKVPGLVRLLHPNFDAISRLERIAGAAGGRDVAAQLLDRDRRYAIVVVTDEDGESSTEPSLELIDALSKVAHDMTGIARIYTADAEAANQLANVVGYNYRIEPGQLRIYLPNINRADPGDRSRHRFMWSYRFRTRPRNAVREISQVVSQYSSTQRPPATWEVGIPRSWRSRYGRLFRRRSG